MKKRSMKILGIIILLIFITVGCSKINEDDKNKEKNKEKNINIVNIYDKKRLEYTDNDDYRKGYRVESGGTSFAKRVTYNAKEDGSVISGYTADIKLISEEDDIKEEDFLKFAEVEFMRYMDSDSINIVQMSCIIKTPDKKEHTFTLRFANEERTKVVQYIENGKDGEYKEVDNSYIEKAGKADDRRYFYTKMGNRDFLFNDVESGEVSDLNVDVSELVFGKNIDAGYACDIIMSKADEFNEKLKEEERGYVCSGIIFQIETNGKQSGSVAVIYEEDEYKIFKFNDGTGYLESQEKIDGRYVDRDLLEEEIEKIL